MSQSSKFIFLLFVSITVGVPVVKTGGTFSGMSCAKCKSCWCCCCRRCGKSTSTATKTVSDQAPKMFGGKGKEASVMKGEIPGGTGLVGSLVSGLTSFLSSMCDPDFDPKDKSEKLDRIREQIAGASESMKQFDVSDGIKTEIEALMQSSLLLAEEEYFESEFSEDQLARLRKIKLGIQAKPANHCEALIKSSVNAIASLSTSVADNAMNPNTLPLPRHKEFINGAFESAQKEIRYSEAPEDLKKDVFDGLKSAVNSCGKFDMATNGPISSIAKEISSSRATGASTDYCNLLIATIG